MYADIKDKNVAQMILLIVLEQQHVLSSIFHL